ncbi:MAG: hypothetical protein ACT4P1_12400 [Sporichthyaceae bacterium]
MNTRVLGVLLGTVLSTAVVGCGGGEDKVTDVNSSTAQECKSELSKLFDQALNAGAAGLEPAFTEDTAPESCKKVSDDTGREIMAQITREAGAKATAGLDELLKKGPGGAPGPGAPAAPAAP